MLFIDHLVLIRGGGDLATGVAYRIHKAGFPVMMFELPRPLVVRRKAALASAVLENEVLIEDLKGIRVDNLEMGVDLSRQGLIPVLIQPKMPVSLVAGASNILSILVDARMAKRNIDTSMDQAPLVVALGPGFTAGRDCHAVIETNRGHRLGRVIWEGRAAPDTGRPGSVKGRGVERVLHAPLKGTVSWQLEIGQTVSEGTVLGTVGDKEITAPFSGVVRGLIAEGTIVRSGMKIGDIDPRNDKSTSYTISDKSLAVGGGVLEAILTWLNGQQVKVE